MGKVTRHVVSAPFHASGRDWIGAGALAAAVGFTFPLDEHVRSEVVTWDGSWTSTVDDIGHTFQQTPLFFGTAVGFWGVGYAAKKPELRRIGPELVVGFAVAQAGTQLVKHLAGRARPYLDEGSGKFRGPTLKDHHLSFWSGDVTTSFVLASVLSEEARQPLITVLLYGLASTTAFQRIHTDHHWLSDVTAAAVWSSAVGVNVVRFARAESHDNRARGVTFVPLGIQVRW
jgi:membrane-associated phospholipid phosphatase